MRSTAYQEKPLLHHLNLDLLLKIWNHTFFNPFFAVLGPFAFRAQGFQYHHGPMYWSMIYTVVILVWWILNRLNIRYGYGLPRGFDWTEEVIVVTGGASGLGLLIAEVYGMRGVSVAVLDRTESIEGGEARNVYFYRCDIGDRKAVEEVAKKIEKELGTPTVLINNAGVVHGKSILDASPEEITDTINSNLTSNFWTIKQFLPGMLKSNRGTIVTISSVLASVGPKRTADYSATKAAQRALHQALTAELGGVSSSIKTLLVTPGQMSNDLFAGVETPSNFFAPVLEPVDVAKEIIAAIDGGAGGEISMPAYSRWIAIMAVLPVSVQRLLRHWSGCDRAMDKGFVGKKGIKEKRYRDESGGEDGDED